MSTKDTRDAQHTLWPEAQATSSQLRDYFEAHEAAYQQITGAGFAACMAAANAAAQQLRNLPRPPHKVYL